jgi:transcriptional/translational regulatory protein YebC/TACO1
MIPDNTIELDGEEALKAMKLIEALEENDDVQTVFSNLELSDEAASKLN